jgi:hypothetical protein
MYIEHYRTIDHPQEEHDLKVEDVGYSICSWIDGYICAQTASIQHITLMSWDACMKPLYDY